LTTCGNGRTILLVGKRSSKGVQRGARSYWRLLPHMIYGFGTLSLAWQDQTMISMCCNECGESFLYLGRPKKFRSSPSSSQGIACISPYHRPWNLYILIDLVPIFLSDPMGQCFSIRGVFL
jgi:hypothetical protein